MSTLIIILVLQTTVYAQETMAINHKGTQVSVRNTVVTTAASAPSDPLQNDIWFDTAAEVTKVYNGTIWLTINLDALAKKEDSANKSTDINLADGTNTKFPTELAVKTYVDTELAALVDDDITNVSFDGTHLRVDEGTTNFSADLSALEESADITANTTLINNHIAADDDLSATNELQNAAEVSIEDTAGNYTATNVEAALAELATAPDKNIYSDNGALSTNRDITQNNFDLNFDSNTLVISGDDDRIGIGTASPSSKLDVNGTTRIRTLPAGTGSDELVTVDTNGNLKKLPIGSMETKTSIAQNTGTGIITHNSEDGSSQAVNLVSTNANNSISVGSDGGAYYESPIKSYGILIPDSNTYTASGISGVVKNATGRYTFTMSTPRSSANYPIQLSLLETGSNRLNIYVTAQTTTTFSISIIRDGSTFLTYSYVDRTCYFTVLDF
ncbi:hypothetical protein [Zobellia uliginosa]|uniref:hypothetical protein n=1 Tax=Zobellia uliginosa TaxID=143224 RepID=UPI0026E186F1|nr:hypothetical protein [Zobellia uliginosa]MDO6516723.1 hypothetical protein [Zobellia uliginosa]